MKNALISPNEPVQTGYRIAEVSDITFQVAQPLFWAICDNAVTAEKYWYDPTDQIIKAIPERPLPTVIEAADQPVVTGANTL
jgi:hypothetical protein